MGWFSRKNWGAEHAVFAAATAATVVGGVLGNEKLQRVAKPLIAPALAVRVLRRGRDTDRVDTALLLLGLAGATVGDVFMIDPDDDRRLVRGASSFAVMQASYSTVLARHGARPHAVAAVPRAVAALGAASLLAAKSRNVAAPLTGYGALLATTATLAADPVLAPGSAQVAGMPLPSADRRSWLGLGGFVFTLSDGTIVGRRVLLTNEKARALAEGFVLATYAAAQLLLVEGMLASRRDRRSGRNTRWCGGR
ncbi:lysoplasmalogenase family protein [Rhodococcus phenolicus]|uniref:lysoplasmalogenase family protein n=1 Tax=Rhodococcus phenolicus TaxID=263849 RepID=UPI00082BBC8E|nr:lysoplasmalogenase family protein [Rhodococcus phenolicus]